MDLVTPEFGLLFWQTITFLLVLLVLSKFAWKPIVQALKEREQGIEEAINTAKKAREEIENLKSDNQKLLQEARAEKEQILKEAQILANQLVAEAKEKANSEANRILENAKNEITASQTKAMSDIKNYVAELSLQIAGRVIRKNLESEAAQSALVEQYLKEINTKSN